MLTDDNTSLPESFKNTGLNNEEVLKQRQEFGLNKIEEAKKDTLFKRILRQLIDPMVIMLIVAAIISLVIAIIDLKSGTNEDYTETVVSFVEPAVIFLIIIINTTFGVVQEGKVSKEIDALQKLTSPSAKVIRNSELIIIPAAEIVKGDLLFLEAGDSISADGILLEEFNLECDESVLTGETVLVKKDINEPDQSKRILEHQNRVFSGTNVINGSAKVLVDAIGNETQIGQIAKLINAEKTNLTPFQQQVHKLSKYISIIAIIVAFINFFVYIAISSKGFDIANYWADSIKVSIALAIAAIPEGMIAVIMVILTKAVQRMNAKKALIKRMPSVETLGSASIICSDKTGTLTQNKMTVTKMWSVENPGLSEDKTINKLMLEYGTLCTNGSVKIDENGETLLVGDPTETSIVQALLDLGISKKDLENKYIRVLELPFESDRKMMTVVVKNKEDNKYIVITKGAPDQVFKICSTNQETIDLAHAINKEMGDQALRVLGVSYKIMDNFDPKNEELSYYESNQQLVGLLGIIDPPRKEVKQSIQECLDAQIRPIMITGDHKNTAVAIAKELGIMQEGHEALSGAELSVMTDEELANNIEKYAVYARVSPQDKIRIVKAWQSKEKIVSMTGDGVNDAPSLKAADIGCAMGITGTDVSKQAADVILVDDNFSTIVEAVKEGRHVMKTVKQVLVLLLTTCFSCLFVIFFGTLAFGKSVLGSLQILWTNVVTETIPGMMLAIYQSKENLMVFPPRNKNEFILQKPQILKICILVLIITFLSIISFYIGVSVSLQNVGSPLAFNWSGIWNNHIPKIHLRAGSSLTFLTLATSLAFNSLCLAEDKSIFKMGDCMKSYKLVLIGFFSAFGTILFITYIPGVNTAFNMNPYDTKWANVLPYIFILIVLATHEIFKLSQTAINNKKQQNAQVVIN